MSDVDKLFAAPLPQVSDFVFDHNVARVFPDMIKRSIPGYPTIIENIGVIAGQHALPGTLIYDLGCSLGAATQSMRRHLRQEGCHIIAVDNAEAMVQRCREYLSAQDAMIEELVPATVVGTGRAFGQAPEDHGAVSNQPPPSRSAKCSSTSSARRSASMSNHGSSVAAYRSMRPLPRKTWSSSSPVTSLLPSAVFGPGTNTGDTIAHIRSAVASRSA